MVLTFVATCFLAFASTVAYGDDKADVKGIITSRTGEMLIVKTGDGNVTVVLTDSTEAKDDKGLFGLEKQQMSNVVLIPGLKVDVDGTPAEGGRVVANTITVDGDDLETAEMIQAGLHPTAEQVAANMKAIETNAGNIAANKMQLAAHKESIEANQQNIYANKQQIEESTKNIDENTTRFTALSEYDVKGQATVTFGVGSTKISAADQEELKKLAQTATGLTGYIVEYGAAAPNEIKAGLAENRRVEVKVLVNKGIAGS